MGKQNIKMALKNRKVPGMVKYCSKIGYSLSPITRNPQVAERVKPLWEKRDHSNYKNYKHFVKVHMMLFY